MTLMQFIINVFGITAIIFLALAALAAGLIEFKAWWKR